MTYLFALCLCEKTVFLRLCVLASITYKTVENLPERLVDVYCPAFTALRIQGRIEEHCYTITLPVNNSP